jgi:hypothetical protein
MRSSGNEGLTYEWVQWTPGRGPRLCVGGEPHARVQVACTRRRTRRPCTRSSWTRPGQRYEQVATCLRSAGIGRGAAATPNLGIPSASASRSSGRRIREALKREHVHSTSASSFRCHFHLRTYSLHSQHILFEAVKHICHEIWCVSPCYPSYHTNIQVFPLQRISHSLYSNEYTGFIQYYNIQSALFNFQSLLLVILLMICTCTYMRAVAPRLIDRNKQGCVSYLHPMRFYH